MEATVGRRRADEQEHEGRRSPNHSSRPAYRNADGIADSENLVFEGKLVYLEGRDYVVGALVRDGKPSRRHHLRNVRYSLSLHMVQVRQKYLEKSGADRSMSTAAASLASLQIPRPQDAPAASTLSIMSTMAADGARDRRDTGTLRPVRSCPHPGLE
jgi:hypothetical protein